MKRRLDKAKKSFNERIDPAWSEHPSKKGFLGGADMSDKHDQKAVEAEETLHPGFTYKNGSVYIGKATGGWGTGLHVEEANEPVQSRHLES